MGHVAAFLLTYNQEDYVREAAQDVLAQDIDDLKVIFSDDGSTDRTFEILMEVGGAYKGNKHLIIRRNHVNMGLNAHLNRLIELTKEDILIPFSGDDRFDPSRARLLTEVMRREDAWLAHSDLEFIGPDGSKREPDHQNATFYNDTSAVAAATSDALFVGATAAWHRQLFTKYGPLPTSEVYEDLVLGFRAALEGSVAYVPGKLVCYRTGVGSSYQDRAKESGSADLAGERLRIERSLKLYEARLSDMSMTGQGAESQVVEKLQVALQSKQAELDLLEKFESIKSRDESDIIDKFNEITESLTRKVLNNSNTLPDAW